MNNNCLFFSIVICCSLIAMDDPSKQAHLRPAIIKTLPIVGSNFVKYTADGKYLVNGTYYKIFVTDTQSYQTVWNPDLQSNHDTCANVCDVSAQQEIVSAMPGIPLTIWNIETQSSRILADVTKSAVMPVFNAKGDQLAVGHFFDDIKKDKIAIFDLNSNKYTIQSQAGALPYGVWNPTDNNEICVVSGPVPGPKKVQIFDCKTTRFRDVADFDTNFCGANWSNDGKLVIGCPGYFAVCDPKKAIKLLYYNLQGKPLDAPPASHQNIPRTTTLHFLDGDKIKFLAAAYYGNIYYGDFDDPSQSFDFPPVLNPNGNLCNIDINPNQKQLAVANYSLATDGVEILDISHITQQKEVLAEVKKEAKEQVKEQLTAKNNYWGTCRQS